MHYDACAIPLLKVCVQYMLMPIHNLFRSACSLYSKHVADIVDANAAVVATVVVGIISGCCCCFFVYAKSMYSFQCAFCIVQFYMLFLFLFSFSLFFSFPVQFSYTYFLSFHLTFRLRQNEQVKKQNQMIETVRMKEREIGRGMERERNKYKFRIETE